MLKSDFQYTNDYSEFLYTIQEKYDMKYEPACRVIHALVPTLCGEWYILELLSVLVLWRALENVASPYVVCRPSFAHLLFKCLVNMNILAPKIGAPKH